MKANFSKNLKKKLFDKFFEKWTLYFHLWPPRVEAAAAAAAAISFIFYNSHICLSLFLAVRSIEFKLAQFSLDY
jgi:hypothetical protein